MPYSSGEHKPCLVRKMLATSFGAFLINTGLERLLCWVPDPTATLTKEPRFKTCNWCDISANSSLVICRSIVKLFLRVNCVVIGPLLRRIHLIIVCCERGGRCCAGIFLGTRCDVATILWDKRKQKGKFQVTSTGKTGFAGEVSDYIIGLVSLVIGPNKSKKLTRLIALVHNRQQVIVCEAMYAVFSFKLCRLYYVPAS